MKTSTLQKSIQKATGDIRGHVDQLRVEITALREEREWLETGPLPPSEAVDRVNMFVDDQAAKFDVQGKLAGVTLAGRDSRESLADLFKVGGQLVHGHATNGVATGVIDSTVAPMLCHFFSDVIKATLSADIERMHYEPGPPQSERSALIADLTTKIYDLETQEEGLIMAAEEAGIEILRRANCDPAIVLDFRIIETEMLDEPAYVPATVREV